MKKDKPNLIVDPPQVPCDECINNGGKLFDNAVAVCYCPHTQSVGIYDIEKKRWQVLHPVSKEKYEASVRKAKTRIELMDNPQSWWN
jgi:hypothetical protein